MNRTRLQSLLDSLGTDVSRWPDAERQVAERCLASDPAARDMLARAQRLEGRVRDQLDADRDASADADASAARVIAALETRRLPAQRRRLVLAWPSALLGWDFAPAWPRVAALAFVAALGFFVGLVGIDPEFEDGIGSTAAATDLATIEPDPFLENGL